MSTEKIWDLIRWANNQYNHPNLKPIEDEVIALEFKEEALRDIKDTLDATPGAVRVREGGGYENLAASVAVTISKFRDRP